MRNYNLGFISDELIFNHIKETVLLYKTVINLDNFNSNIVDPIKLTFDSKVYGKSFEEIIESFLIFPRGCALWHTLFFNIVMTNTLKNRCFSFKT